VAIKTELPIIEQPAAPASLAELGLDRFKIPSGEITNLPYLRHVGRYGRQVILSTGMATLGEIESALGSFVQYQKLNYLMLMMVDPQVHFHVIPRYEGSRALPPIPASSASSCSTLRYSPRGPGRSWSSWQWSSAGNCSLSSAARNSARATRS